MKKAFAILLTLALVFVMIAACGENEDRPLRVGFSQGGSDSDWSAANTASVSEAIERADWELVFEDAEQVQENQIGALRDFISQRVDYIVFNPVVETGWDAILQEVKDAKIPLVLIDGTIDLANREEFYVSWITNNFEHEGIAAANWLFDYLAHTGRSDDDINIVELKGTLDSGSQNQRLTGFHKTVEGHSNLHIRQSETGNYETSLGKTVMESFMGRAAAEGYTIDVVFAHNDDMALGAIQAIKEAGLNPGEDIIIIGVSAGKPAFEAIIAGEMNATVESSPLMGQTVVDVINQHHAGTTPPKTMFNNVRVFDETLYSVFPDRYLQAGADLANRVY